MRYFKIMNKSGPMSIFVSCDFFYLKGMVICVNLLSLNGFYMNNTYTFLLKLDLKINIQNAYALSYENRANLLG